MRSYWNKTHRGSDSESPISTKWPRQSGWLILIVTQTGIQRPRHLPLGEASTYSNRPSEVLIAFALVLFMRLSGRLWICIQKEAVSNLASSMDSNLLGLYRSIRYLSKDHHPWEMIFIASASSEKRISTVLEVRSRSNLKILYRPPYALQGAW